MRTNLLSIVSMLLAGVGLHAAELWRPMPFVREAEFKRGYPGGEGMQLPYCTVRAP